MNLPLSPDVMRLFLLACQFGMILLAVFFLRRRKLTLPGYLKWGLFAILTPLVGPFLVIYLRPGMPTSFPGERPTARSGGPVQGNG